MSASIWALPQLTALLMGSSTTVANVEPPIVPQTPNLEAIAPDLADPETDIIDIEDDRTRRYTVPVTIEGAGPFDFMIDTGSQATAVTTQINEGLQLTPFGTATLVAMASTRPVDVVEVDSISFGNQTIHDLVSPVLDRKNVGADGILGLDSLQDFRVLIDFREETIAIQDVTGMRNQKRGFEIVVRADRRLGQLLITEARVEGVRATVIIDTGAQASLGNFALQRRLRTKRAQEVVTTDVNGVELTGDMSFVRSLNLGGLEMRNVPLTFADAPAFAALGLQEEPVISLGMQHLRLFDRVAIDFANRRVLFDVPRDVARALRRQRNRSFNALAQ